MKTAKYTDKQLRIGLKKNRKTVIRIQNKRGRKHIFRHMYPLPTEESLEIVGRAWLFHQLLGMKAHVIVHEYQRKS